MGSEKTEIQEKNQQLEALEREQSSRKGGAEGNLCHKHGSGEFRKKFKQMVVR